ncbi:hypothetical protein BJY52DRAFT_1228188 [Lactarius psammicola]|nr:hypothetical protein BJY52DRAFT_1228188 [Lactarius psammicola]
MQPKEAAAPLLSASAPLASVPASATGDEDVQNRRKCWSNRPTENSLRAKSRREVLFSGCIPYISLSPNYNLYMTTRNFTADHRPTLEVVGAKFHLLPWHWLGRRPHSPQVQQEHPMGALSASAAKTTRDHIECERSAELQARDPAL